MPPEDLRLAWGLAMSLDPSHAASLVVQARKVLRTGEATRQWFLEGMGPECATIRGLLALFWPDEQQLASLCGQRLDARRLACKRVLAALGRNDWTRAKDSLVVRQAEWTTHGRRKMIYHHKWTRLVALSGVAALGERAEWARNDGFKWCEEDELVELEEPFNPSIPSVMLFRAYIADRLRAVREAVRSHQGPPEDLDAAVWEALDDAGGRGWDRGWFE